MRPAVRHSPAPWNSTVAASRVSIPDFQRRRHLRQQHPPAGTGTQPGTAPIFKNVSPDSPLNRSGPMGDADPPPSLPFGPALAAPEQPTREMSQRPAATAGSVAKCEASTMLRRAIHRRLCQLHCELRGIVSRECRAPTLLQTIRQISVKNVTCSCPSAWACFFIGAVGFFALPATAASGCRAYVDRAQAAGRLLDTLWP